MKRKDVLSHIRIAGYHMDKVAFTRLVIDNRIGFDAANEAFRQGIKEKKAGTKCGCFECGKTD